MRSSFLKAFCISALLGGVTALAGAPVLAPVAQAAGVRPQVGKPLKEAVSLANAGKGSAAMEKVHEAESVSGLTATERSTIAQTKQFIAAKTGSGGGSLGCKAKFATDYRAGRYRDVVGADADCLRKSGGYDHDSQVIVAQAYYQMGDYATAVKILRGLGQGDQVLSLLMSAAAKAGDTQTEGQVAERLILQGQSKYWPYILAAADATPKMTDHLNLDVLRVRYLTGNMRNAEDYELLTELALEFHFPAEALAVAQKGFADKKLQGDRDTRLLTKAQQEAAKDAAGLANAQKKASASKSGDDLVSYGENLWGRGQYDDALSAIQAGIGKGGLSKADEAQISLGIAQLSAGHKDDAVKTFGAVKSTPAAQTVAHLWSVYARSGGTAKASANGASSGSADQASTGTSKKRHR